VVALESSCAAQDDDINRNASYKNESRNNENSLERQERGYEGHSSNAADDRRDYEDKPIDQGAPPQLI